MIESDGFDLLFTLYPSLVYFEITGWMIFSAYLIHKRTGGGSSLPRIVFIPANIRIEVEISIEVAVGVEGEGEEGEEEGE